MMRKVRIYQDGVLTASPKPLSSSLPLSGPSEEESLTREKEKVELPERDETPPIKVLGWLARSYELFKHSFLPQGFPSSVHPNFTPYAGWFFLQNIVGTCVYVLCTQALLLSMGMASKNAITSAAALQWVIKDGVGQFGGIITAGLLGTRFDLEPKKLRFLAVLAMYVASFIEISTLAQPSYFLLFASVANLVKNIAWIILSATRASQLVQMSKTGNLGDLTAKMGSQGTASSLLGTIIGVSISSYLTLSSFPSFMSIYVPLACLGLFSLYRSTSFMVTNTLNRERLNILLDYFWCNYSRHMASAENPWFIICQDECDVADEFILTIDQVSVEESFVSPIVRWNYLPHVAINSTLKSPHNFEVFSQTLEHADDVSSGSPTGSRPVAVKNDRYLLNVDPIRRKPIYVWLTECSTSVDHIEAYFLCYILPKFHYDMEKFKALQGLFRSWRKAMERNGWNMDKFYYPEMEKRVVRLSSSFKSE